jgi:hypothetical protein
METVVVYKPSHDTDTIIPSNHQTILDLFKCTLNTLPDSVRAFHWVRGMWVFGGLSLILPLDGRTVILLRDGTAKVEDCEGLDDWMDAYRQQQLAPLEVDLKGKGRDVPSSSKRRATSPLTNSPLKRPKLSPTSTPSTSGRLWDDRIPSFVPALPTPLSRHSSTQFPVPPSNPFPQLQAPPARPIPPLQALPRTLSGESGKFSPWMTKLATDTARRLDRMSTLLLHGRGSRRYTQAEAWEMCFWNGVPFPRTTWQRHRDDWESVEESVRNRWLDDNPDRTWGEFLAMCVRRPDPPKGQQKTQYVKEEPIEAAVSARDIKEELIEVSTTRQASSSSTMRPRPTPATHRTPATHLASVTHRTPVTRPAPAMRHAPITRPAPIANEIIDISSDSDSDNVTNIKSDRSADAQMSEIVELSSSGEDMDEVMDPVDVDGDDEVIDLSD